MRAEDLLTRIEPLSHGERCRRLAETARRGVAPELLAELGAGGHYERSVAIFLASAARDEAGLRHLESATLDPAADLAEAAIGWSARLGARAEAFTVLLDDAPAGLRAATYQAIRRWRRADLAEALIDRVAARWGEDEAASLLPACGEAVARERLAALAHAVPNWRSLGRAHPGLVLDHAETALPALPEATRRTWWWNHAAGVAAAAEHAPERVIDLLERHWRDGQLPSPLASALGLLLDAEQDRTARFLLADANRPWLTDVLRGHPAVRRRMVRLDEAGLATVARAVSADEQVLRLLLSAFPPARREHVFALAMTGYDLAADVPDLPLLDVLPAARRIAEARRALRLREVAGDRARTWDLTSYLPYDEAFPVLDAIIRRPDAQERATGYRLLISCAGRTRDPDVLTGLFDALARLRNEQDPVRWAALHALATMPPSMLRSGHGPALTRLADDALAARDCSSGTRGWIAALADRLCRQGAMRGDGELLATGLGLYERLTGHSGGTWLGRRLDHILPRGAEHDLVRVLAPRLADAQRRDDHTLVFGLTRSLGRRAHAVPELQDALGNATGARSDSVAANAIGLWLQAPAARGDRVARLLSREPSAVALPSVFAVLATGRTDLLTGALSGDVPAGRFAAADVVHVPTAQRRWMRRWTGEQRALYLELKHLLAQDAGTPDARRAAAVRDIGEVPGVGADELRPYLDHADDALRRAALTTAPWIATPQDVLPVLLDRASGDDAHVALYAASRASRYVAPGALAAALGPVLTAGKITARKEAVRILLRSRVPEAMALIEAAWDDPGQHRDVRSAIASALRDRLGDPVATRLLTEAANGPRDLARQVLGAPPLHIDERHRTAYAALVLQVARSGDVETREAALPALSSWAPWAPEIPALLAGLVTDLDAPDWRAALEALTACATTGTGAGDLSAAAAALAALPAEPDAEAERDRPAAQRLRVAAEYVRGRSVFFRDAAEPAIRALDGQLPEPQASVLLAATFRWDEPDAAARLDAIADRPVAGVLPVRAIARALAAGAATGWSYHSPSTPEPEDVLPHAERLAARGDLPGGLFACALVGEHGPESGWDDEWRALLRRLRAHPHPDVAYSARDIITAEE
ncbi:hypothetical protein [Spirillospora sp. NPDC047279]|uniref:hypothetical protein n=1 Tax=Spirillospora sp. NPDC047279 TaxID=3155478 RepID=UPI00340B44C7